MVLNGHWVVVGLIRLLRVSEFHPLPQSSKERVTLTLSTLLLLNMPLTTSLHKNDFIINNTMLPTCLWTDQHSLKFRSSHYSNSWLVVLPIFDWHMLSPGTSRAIIQEPPKRSSPAKITRVSITRWSLKSTNGPTWLVKKEPIFKQTSTYMLLKYWKNNTNRL